MKLTTLSVKGYKSYAGSTTLDLAPLTILVGANNSGKSALARAISLIAGGLTQSDSKSREPLNLTTGGIEHGREFVDLMAGRSSHGNLSLSVSFVINGCESSLSVSVQNVESPSGRSERQISQWQLSRENKQVHAERMGLGQESRYQTSISGADPHENTLSWRGLVPMRPNPLPDWVNDQVRLFGKWATGIRHLRYPRRFKSASLLMDLTPENEYNSSGRTAAQMLISSAVLKDSVRAWYQDVFGVSLGVKKQGVYSDIEIGASSGVSRVLLGQSGSGLLQVLPVAVMALTAQFEGPGVDIIEHPEADLHPAAHAHIADVLLKNLAHAARPVIIETHSEMVLLRTRRWIAEGRIPADSVLIYWIHTEPTKGSFLRKIKIDDSGNLSHWPNGIFIEDYEEILAIRRAARRRQR
ncbi:MAG: AAA family ATPase [Bacteroidota bacterium]|nr:AAA family ATPase [Bacteroidota bacterium]